ncbi:unnamed protein product, partial [Anisakis simplex]|uniref:Myosin_tail_1 domain-containing protein n=1 Tax=Anisakis simplex TaxID=6269 RepID=A0A0M3JE03_ANISI
MRQREDSMLEDIERLRTSLEESQKNHEEHIKSCTQQAQELRKKTDELSTLRCRLEAVESTKAHQNTTSQRSDCMEDMLVSQVKSLTAQINEMRSARNYDE